MRGAGYLLDPREPDDARHHPARLMLAFGGSFAALLLLGCGALYLVLVRGYREAYDHRLIETPSWHSTSFASIAANIRPPRRPSRTS